MPRTCREDAWAAGHELQCTGCIDQEHHALIQFKLHAVTHNEIFLLVADAVVEMLLLDQPDFMEKLLDFTATPWWHVATEPLLQSPTELQDAIMLDTTLQRLCRESSHLLQQALLLHKDLNVARVQALCTTEMFGKLIGSFEQNAIGIRQRNPLCRSVLNTHERKEYRKDLMACLTQAGMLSDTNDDTISDDNNSDDMKEFEYSDDEIAHFLSSLEMDEQVVANDLDDMLTPLDGTAMYATACKMNHSCRPNVVVLYPQQSQSQEMPLCIHVVALTRYQRGRRIVH